MSVRLKNLYIDRDVYACKYNIYIVYTYNVNKFPNIVCFFWKFQSIKKKQQSGPLKSNNDYKLYMSDCLSVCGTSKKTSTNQLIILKFETQIIFKWTLSSLVTCVFLLFFSKLCILKLHIPCGVSWPEIHREASGPNHWRTRHQVTNLPWPRSATARMFPCFLVIPRSQISQCHGGKCLSSLVHVGSFKRPLES